MDTTFPSGWTTYWMLRTVLKMTLDEAHKAMLKQRPSRDQYDTKPEYEEAIALSRKVRAEWYNLSRYQVRQLEVRQQAEERQS